MNFDRFGHSFDNGVFENGKIATFLQPKAFAHAQLGNEKITY